MTASPPEVCVVGSLNVDHVAKTARHPAHGETVLGTSYETFLGGKGFNQAVAAARAGARVAMIGRVGNDPDGRRLVAALQREGVDVAHVHVDTGAGTGVAAITVDEAGENSIVVVPRANGRLTATDVDGAADLIGDARVLLLQLEVPLDTVAAAARRARSGGTTVVLNPAPAPDSLRPLGGLVDVMVLNQSEAERLAGHLPRTGLVVTLGAAGVRVDTEVIGPHAVRCVDSVGAGDAFCGALAASLAGASDLPAAARFANAAGALAVTVAGAEPSLPTRAAILKLLGDGP